MNINLSAVLRALRPFWLLTAALLFALGVGVARYLGRDISPTIYIWGQIWLTTLQLALQTLHAYFTPPDPAAPPVTPYPPGERRPLLETPLRREVLLWVALLLGAGEAWFTLLLVQAVQADGMLYLLMALILLLGLAFAVPPLRLEQSGYGELALAVLFPVLTPALAFSLQTGELHRLLAMCAFPLATLFLAMLLANQLANFAADQRRLRRNLMALLGWSRGMTLHNWLIAVAFLLLSLAVLLGMPRSIAWPSFLALPLGALQLWQMRRILEGARPNWRLLRMNAAALFGGMAYLMTLAFWLN